MLLREILLATIAHGKMAASSVVYTNRKWVESASGKFWACAVNCTGGHDSQSELKSMEK